MKRPRPRQERSISSDEAKLMRKRADEALARRGQVRYAFNRYVPKARHESSCFR